MSCGANSLLYPIVLARTSYLSLQPRYTIMINHHRCNLNLIYGRPLIIQNEKWPRNTGELPGTKHKNIITRLRSWYPLHLSSSTTFQHRSQCIVLCPKGPCAIIHPLLSLFLCPPPPLPLPLPPFFSTTQPSFSTFLFQSFAKKKRIIPL